MVTFQLFVIGVLVAYVGGMMSGRAFTYAEVERRERQRRSVQLPPDEPAWHTDVPKPERPHAKTWPNGVPT